MAKILTAVRHAKSSWRDPSLSDKKRPLNARGKMAAPAMARYLLRLEHLPQALLSSPARRAWDTAALMAAEFGILESAIKKDDRLYFDGMSGILDAVRDTDDAIDHLFFFSHEPIIGDFCRQYADLDPLVNYPTAAVCAMQFEVDHWRDIGQVSGKSEKGKKGHINKAQKLFFVIPKKIDPAL